MTDPPSTHRPAQRTVAALVLGCAALSGTVAAATTGRRSTPTERAAPSEQQAPTDDASRPTLTADDVPDDAFVPLQEGDATVASFRGFVARQLVDPHGDHRPDPPSLAALGSTSDVVAHGTVASVALVQHPVELGGLSAARIELQMVLDPASILGGQAPEDEVWHLPVWLGDPAFAPAVAEMLETELGAGPIGADAVLFGVLVDPSSPFGGGLTIVDGIVQGGPEIARLARTTDPKPAELTNVQRALEAAGT
jgi:hypothetical protein